MAKKHIETVLIGAKDLKEITDALVSCGGDVKHFTKPVMWSIMSHNPLISTLRHGNQKEGFVLLPIGQSQEIADLIDSITGTKGNKYLLGICSADSAEAAVETLAYVLNGKLDKFAKYYIA